MTQGTDDVLRHPVSTTDHASVWLMLLLTFGTGVLDAATFLGLDGVFTANMTGNLVFVGLGLAGSSEVPLVRASLALGGFVIGALVVGLLRGRREVRPNADALAAGTFLGSGLALGAAALALQMLTLSADGKDVLTTLIALVMGAQTAAARRVGVPDVNTVVVTLPLAALAADVAWIRNRAGWHSLGRRGGAVLSVGLGATVSAFLMRTAIAVPVALASLILLLVAAAYIWRAVRDRRTRTDPSGKDKGTAEVTEQS